MWSVLFVTRQLAPFCLMSAKPPRAIAGVTGFSRPQTLDKTMCDRKHLIGPAGGLASPLASFAWSPSRCSGKIGSRRCAPSSDPPRGGMAVTFKEVLAQVLEWLQHDQRISYRAVKRQFALDDDYLEGLKEARIDAYPQVIDDGRGLVWTGASEGTPAPHPAPSQAAQRAEVPGGLPQGSVLLPEPQSPEAER